MLAPRCGRSRKLLSFGLAAPALLLALTCARAGVAETAWTLEQVLQTLPANPAALARLSEQTAARASLDSARWLRYPGAGLELSAQDAGQHTGTLRVDQPLWTGGRVSATIDGAAKRLDASTVAIEELRLDLTLRAIGAFTEALRQAAREQLAAASRAEHETLLATVRRRVAEDASPLTDQRLAEARTLQAATELNLTVQALQAALAQLSSLAGTDVGVVVEGGLARHATPTDLPATLATATAFSPTARRLALEEAAADADVALQRAAVMPTVALRAERLGGAVRDNRLMLTFQMQTGPGLSARSEVEAAVARRDAIRDRRLAALRDVRERVTLDWTQWTAAQDRLTTATQSTALYLEVLDSYKRQFAVGRKTPVELLNAVRDVTSAQYAEVDARLQALAAGLRLLANTGGMTGAYIEEPPGR